MDSFSEREFDVIVFGATGFTGKYVVEELAVVSETHHIKWAVAGRNSSKLRDSLFDVQGFIPNSDLANSITIIEADVKNQGSLSEMCRRAKLILNCVGPYRFYGEAVVRACIENGTHHVDISGEFKYLEESQTNFFEAARKKGVYIIQACGFDSIPADLGTMTLKKRFPGQLQTVDVFMKFQDDPRGKVTNAGTWVSAVHSIIDLFRAKKIRQDLKEKIFKKEMPDYEIGINYRNTITYSDYVKKWCLPLPVPDVPVIQRSQMFNYEFLDDPPMKEAKVYLCAGSFFSALSLYIAVAIIGGLSLFSFGRYLLGKFPNFFSAGYFSSEGPSRSQVENSTVVLMLNGKGTSDGHTSEDGENAPLLSHAKQSMNLKIVGPEPAYMLTSRCMVHAGLTILEESSRMPLQGGVLTPGFAFVKTTLLDRLASRGIQFEWL